ncbi:hypothetical protein BGZ76_011105 [Entomortierella beljakovae]|nr:hypothetical protein BGZ76_011105 [Entomortierella beljakovae]
MRDPIQAGDGFKLKFGLKGQILDSLTSTPSNTNVQNNIKGVSRKEGTVDQEELVAAAPQSLQSAVTQPIETSAYAGNSDQESSLDSEKCHKARPVSNSSIIVVESSADVAASMCNSSSSYQSGPVFFTEFNSQMDISELCKQSVFEKQLNQQKICVVNAQPLADQDATNQKYSWTWTKPPKDYQEDQLNRKATYAVNPLSGTISILSKFSLWVHNSRPITEVDRLGGLRHSGAQAGSPTSRHWRHASTPERFTSGLSRLQSFHPKGPLVPSSHASLPSLPDAAIAAGGQGLIHDISGSSGSLPSLNSATFAIETEDGPLFRATVLECENNIRDMKASTKKIIKAAQTVLESRKALAVAEEAFIKELEGFKPAEPLLNSYLKPMTQSLAEKSDKLSNQMRTLLIEPLSKFYLNDIKAAEVHKKSFEDESKEYYSTLSRYMAMKQDNDRKKIEADAKYEKKRRQFEIKRFEYWSFLLDMRVGGSKSDEILHHFTSYSEKHWKDVMDTAYYAETLKYDLDTISGDLSESRKRAAHLRKERHERRKELQESFEEQFGSTPNPTVIPKGSSSQPSSGPNTLLPSVGSEVLLDGSTDLLNVSEELNEELNDGVSPAAASTDQRVLVGSSPTPPAALVPASQNSTPKFTGIRDLEHQDIDASQALGKRKEGFLFSTNRPSAHNNSTVLEKSSINWHKYWCVVSEGYLHEYSQWKKGVTMLHNEPINLKISTVRPCRNQDRRFCFEVITPKYRRIYQATSTEDMNSWISVISNAIQSLLNGNSSYQNLDIYRDTKLSGESNILNTSGASRASLELAALQGQSPSVNGPGEFSSSIDSTDFEHLGTRLLKLMRDMHPSNNFCAECGAKSPDWCAINLGILICIECSGIHRGLGTHISKIRSFTLDTTSYTKDLFDFIRSVGNEASNKIWEANLVNLTHDEQPSDNVSFRRPVMNDSREYKFTFVQKKYVEKAFVRKVEQSDDTEVPEEQAILATRALFQAVVSNNIIGVIGAFAAGADLNAVEEAELENEMIASGSSQMMIDADGVILDESQIQSNLENFSMSSEASSRLSRSTIASSILNVPAIGSTLESQSTQPSVESLESNSGADNCASSFMVMQTSPLLLALRNGAPFSLDERYEVYPMAEFMLQNGASSNLSVEVRLLDDDVVELGSTVIPEGASNNADDLTFHSGGLLIQSSGLTTSSNILGWDQTQTDLDDARSPQQKNNRRSLGQVVNLRGEEGASAMEYLRSKSAARGEHISGSPPIGSQNDTGISSAAQGSTSPPMKTLSPRLRAQYATLSAGSVSAPTSVFSSPSIPGPGPGAYSTTVIRQQPASTHQDISSLFLKRRESDGGISKSTDSEKRSGGYKLQNAAMVPSSPAVYESTAQSQTTQGHGPGSSRAHKVKATLSKSLRLSAAYIKNNMMKEEKDIPVVPSITQTAASPASTSASPSTTLPKQKEVVPSPSANQESSQPSSSALMSPMGLEQARDTATTPLSGSYVFLHKKGAAPNTNNSASPKPNPNSGSGSGTTTNTSSS